MVKPVSTLYTLIRTIDATTLYHVTAMLWYYMKHRYFQTRCYRYFNVISYLGKEKAQEKNTLHFGFSCSYLQNELGYAHLSDQKAKTRLSAKFKKILCCGIRGTLQKHRFKVALNPFHRICLNFAESFILAFWSLSRNGGH